MSVTFTTLKKLIPILLTQKNPILLRGRHGVGKSEFWLQCAKQLGKRVVEKRPSQMTEGDWTGLPKLTELASNSVTEWCIPYFLNEACKEGVVLFLDEIDRAPLEVRQGIFQLADSRRMDKWTLHPDTVLVAACNGGEDAGSSQYQVGELDPAELDRWTVIDVAPTVEELVEWGKEQGNIHPLILTFITENPKHLEHTKDFEPGKVYPSRRSWKRLSDNLTACELLTEENKDNSIFVSLCSGYVGFEASIALADYVKNYSFAVSPEEIIDQGKIEKVKSFKVTDFAALLEKVDIKGYFKKKLTKKQLENLSNFVVAVPSEFVMNILVNIGKDKGEATGDQFAIVEHNIKGLYTANNNQVKEYMKTILSNPSVLESIEKKEDK